jgi:hypothetical protein
MKNQTADTVASEVVPNVAGVKVGKIEIPAHLRPKCHIVSHGQQVRIIGDDPKDRSRYIVAGDGISGAVPVRKQFVRVFT